MREFVKWVLEEENTSSKIKVKIYEGGNSTLETFEVVDVEGASLVCENNGKVVLVGSKDVEDPEEFKRLFLKINPKKQQATWEDGTPVDLPTIFP